MPKSKGELTLRQERFIQLYEGDATAAARAAGYKAASAPAMQKQAHKLIHTPAIAEAIRLREERRMSSKIASREARQQMWTDTMNDPIQTMANRLKASELLGKSSGDFIDRVALQQGDGKGGFKAVTLILATEDVAPANGLIETATAIVNIPIVPSLNGNGHVVTNGNERPN